MSFQKRKQLDRRTRRGPRRTDNSRDVRQRICDAMHCERLPRNQSSGPYRRRRRRRYWLGVRLFRVALQMHSCVNSRLTATVKCPLFAPPGTRIWRDVGPTSHDVAPASHQSLLQRLQGNCRFTSAFNKGTDSAPCLHALVLFLTDPATACKTTSSPFFLVIQLYFVYITMPCI